MGYLDRTYNVLSTRWLRTVDGGVVHGYHMLLGRAPWQMQAERQRTPQVCHFPLETRQWNPIEHRMCCPIPSRARSPLVSWEVGVNLRGSSPGRTVSWVVTG
jgi:hypothetical protein